MKVLHVNAGNESGGGMVHIISLLTGLRLQGIDAVLVVLEEGPVAQSARKASIPVSVIGQLSRYDWSARHRLRQLIEAESGVIVHTHGPRSAVYMSSIIHTLKSVAWVATVHSDPYHDFQSNGWLGTLWCWLYMQSLRKADQLIMVSDKILKCLSHTSLGECPAEVIRSGIPYTKNDIPKPSFSKHKGLRFITVGRLEPVKQYLKLLSTLGRMRELEWSLYMIGDGQEREALETLAQELQIDDRITFTGWIKHDQIPHYLRRSDVCLLSSQSEGFPLVALEAMREGVPIIGTNVGDMHVLYTKRSSPYLVENMEGTAYEKALRMIYKEWQEGTLEELGQCFYEQGKLFSLDQQITKTIALYHTVVQRSGGQER